MLTQRLNYLAYHHAPRRAIVSKEWTSTGYNLELECGHRAHTVAHQTPGAHHRCYHCGIEVVKNAPEYADEF